MVGGHDITFSTFFISSFAALRVTGEDGRIHEYCAAESVVTFRVLNTNTVEHSGIMSTVSYKNCLGAVTTDGVMTMNCLVGVPTDKDEVRSEIG